jgi:hypothetical protein
MFRRFRAARFAAAAPDFLPPFRADGGASRPVGMSARAVLTDSIATPIAAPAAASIAIILPRWIISYSSCARALC